ncbi:MAG: hypothetical protein A2V66_14855 [Ignavibacteria bacterium RBG_13_36_8]|nr:MAG: hypothetical protein A2V66_14855 [Ignavibacteria bacterium RBG_13_36_8]
MQITFYDIVGSVGVASIIIAYLMLQLNKIKSSQLLYSLLNGFGAVLIIFSLMYDFNLSAFIIESFWVVISLVGVVAYFKRRYS